ncbi:hypothetical protein GCM10022219_11030 [Microbacterium oryzae]|uniref:Type IV toxin-antitoxin system AbiEi family antitoxin domain-containing protein n=1 Tax=Microbacterium oryzae TaxID=743009 RepID=A0A6I6E3J7_9MICO|nr:hypothetical protein [Microbacterium oryzae]QGU28519.1 hypothetical protein D7D94_13205 [Microbacterium oryzae]
MADLRVNDVLRHLWSRERLRIEGWRPSRIQQALRRGDLRRVRHGWYVVTDFWDGLHPRQQHLVEIVAAACEMRGGGVVVSHLSAAVLHGFPLVGARPERVHVTLPGEVGASGTGDVARHRLALDEEDITVVDGIRCTGVERTLFDVARSEPAERAIAILDAGLAAAALDHRAIDEEKETAWRSALLRRVVDARGARGLRRGAWLIGFADGRAQLPGESLSRLQLHRLGYAPRLQVPVANPAGGWWWMDFALDEAKVFGEFDGRGKYLDSEMRAGRTAEEVVLDEKRREDGVRGVTGWRIVRWGMAEVRSPDALAKHLAAFHVPLPPSNDVVSSRAHGIQRKPVSFR